MIDTNVVKQHRFLDAIRRDGLAARYFAVSTDKAADPASFMGATKRLLEMVLGAADPPPACSAARFANVAYSSGSLLESFVLRLAAGQPIAVPRDTRRYFITGPQAARICLLAAQTCPPGVVAIPAFASGADALDLGEIAARFLHRHGLKAAFVDSVEAAEAMLATAKAVRSAYPVVVMPRDTAGEKEVEVFHGSAEARIDIGLGALEGLAPQPCDPAALRETLAALAEQVAGSGVPLDMPGLCRLMQRAVPNFRHADSDLSLDDRL
jgi:hypothetical protein